MNLPKLTPCPFCGETEQADGPLDGPLDVFKADEGDQYYVNCGTCESAGPNAPTAKQARNLWNQRFVPPVESIYGHKPEAFSQPLREVLKVQS